MIYYLSLVKSSRMNIISEVIYEFMSFLFLQESSN